MSTDREQLIEAAAKAIFAEIYPDDFVPDQFHRDVSEMKAARAAFAVFEKAHTPTDAEREACGCLVRQIRHVDGEWSRELELIPCDSHRSIVRIVRRDIEADRSDSQKETSDDN